MFPTAELSPVLAQAGRKQSVMITVSNSESSFSQGDHVVAKEGAGTCLRCKD